MRQIITTYVVVVVLLALGFFGVGALAKAAVLREPMQPPALALQEFRQAKWSAKPAVKINSAVKPKQKSLQLTSIACAGVLDSLDYGQRRIQVTVSLDPPWQMPGECGDSSLVEDVATDW